MNKQQAVELLTEMTMALKAIANKHGVELYVLGGSDNAGAVFLNASMPSLIKDMIAGAPGATSMVTSNAIKRYEASHGKLGLPKRGTIIMMGDQQFTLAGLSSDSKRVKGVCGADCQLAHDLPLADVLQAVAMAAGTKLAEITAKDDVQSVDEAASVLKAICGKKD